MKRRGSFLGGSWAIACLVASHVAYAGERDFGAGTALPPKYRQECAACHLAFPPGMLPADAWRRLLGTLSRHYGVDASLDAATVNELTAWLSAHAASDRRARVAPPEDRFTRSTWFVRQHDEVAADVWKRPAVKSAANCAACHTGAEQGDFDEHTVHIPR